MSNKHRCEYTYRVEHGSPVHIWSVVGATSGLHLHIRGYTPFDKSEMRTVDF